MKGRTNTKNISIVVKAKSKAKHYYYLALPPPTTSPFTNCYGRRNLAYIARAPIALCAKRDRI
jgi:hypothetical protein